MLRCYKEGYSDPEVCEELKIPSKEFERRVKEDAAFASLVEIGRLFAKAWWTSQARKNLWNRNFMHQTWYAVMKNRYGWSEKSEVTATDDRNVAEMSRDELEAKLTGMRSKLTKLFGDKDIALSEIIKDGNGLPN